MSEIDTGNIVLYTTEDGTSAIQLYAIDGTVWLSQLQMAELFDKGRTTIGEHIKNILSDAELIEDSVCRNFRHTAPDNKQYLTKYYSLEMILAIGFRVRSPRGVQFRKWANTILQEYLVKGFAMNDVQLKQADNWDYFDEWLARIKDIRTSEKRFYQKIRDLYATAADYDKNSQTAKDFFAKVQNKMLWAVTGYTAAELILHRSDSEKQNMGLQAWKGEIVRKGDVGIAKNYLNQEEVSDLNEIVTMYLDYAERQAKKRQTVTMAQWSEKLDAFLEFNEQNLLTHMGTVSAMVAKQIAEKKYAEYDSHRKQTEAKNADIKDMAEIEKILYSYTEQ